MKTRVFNHRYFIGGTALLVFLIFISSLRPATAQSRKSEKANTTAPEAKKTEKIIVIDEDGNSTTYYEGSIPSSLKKTLEGTVAASAEALERAPGMADALLRDLDLSSLAREVTTTLSAVRISDLAAVADQALDNIDWKGINREVDYTLTEIHRELSNPQMKRDLRTRLLDAQDALTIVADDASMDIAAAREELLKARKELSNTRTSQKDVSSDLSDNSYDTMLDEMEADGLIKRSKGFDIRKSDAGLYINGQAQSNRIYNKYSHFLREKNVSVTGKDDSLTIELKKR
jgi:hypothetical protein